MIPTKVITVDGRRAEVRSVPWRLYRRICSMSADVEEQLDLEEEVALRCATVEGLAREAMLDELSKCFGPEVTWTYPVGGFFVWLTLPPYFDSNQLLSVALERGVAFVPGTNCYPDGRGASSMRIAFCYEKPERIREAIRRLADVVEDRMGLYRAFLDAGALPEREPEETQLGAHWPSPFESQKEDM